MTRAKKAWGWLMGTQHGTSQFFKNVWEKEPLHIMRGDKSYFRNTLNYEDILSIGLMGGITGLDLPDIIPMVLVNKSFSMTVDVDYHSLFEGYLDGQSLIMNHIEQVWPQLGALVLQLAPMFSFPSINLYLTPPGRKAALPFHSDAQDVFIMQMAGRKRWKVWDAHIPPYPEH